MRNELKALKKMLDDKERAVKAAVATSVVETANNIIEANKGTPILVEVLNAYNNTKALDMALKKVKTVSPETSALFISVDEDEKKIFALSAVPKVSFRFRFTNFYWYKAQCQNYCHIKLFIDKFFNH